MPLEYGSGSSKMSEYFLNHYVKLINFRKIRLFIFSIIGKGSITKSLEKYPVFFIHLTCPTTNYDICLDPAKSMIEFKVV